MSTHCNTVVFSNKAYNEIIRETFDKHPLETGGILLGHIIDDVWVIMEVLPPGQSGVFELAYFEYDQKFVNYLADVISSHYKIPLSLLGLWHRHPDSLDTFSSTDNLTNRKFAQLSQYGAISGLVNIDPDFRITIYHIECEQHGKEEFDNLQHKKVKIEVGDDIIPQKYFELKYYDSPNDSLSPKPTTSGKGSKKKQPAAIPKTSSPENEKEPPKWEDVTTKKLIGELSLRLRKWCYRNKKYIFVVIILLFFIILITNINIKNIKQTKEINQEITSDKSPLFKKHTKIKELFKNNTKSDKILFDSLENNRDAALDSTYVKKI